MGKRPLGNITHCHVNNLVRDPIPGARQEKRESLRKGIQPFRITPGVDYCVGSCSCSNMASD